MARVVTLNFKNAPPASGGGGMSDRVPPGVYKITTTKVDESKSKAGNDMLVITHRVNLGEYEGKKLVEYFVLPASADDEQQFGLQRFHSLLISIGSKELKGEQKLDLDALVGKECLAEVDDNEMPATNTQPARVVSRVLAYHHVKAAGVEPTTNGAAEAPAPAPDPTPDADTGDEQPAAAEGVDDLFAGVD